MGWPECLATRLPHLTQLGHALRTVRLAGTSKREREVMSARERDWRCRAKDRQTFILVRIIRRRGRRGAARAAQAAAQRACGARDTGGGGIHAAY